MPLLSRESVKWGSNGLAALACLSVFGFPGLIAYVAGFVVNVYLPRWVGWRD